MTDSIDSNMIGLKSISLYSKILMFALFYCYISKLFHSELELLAPYVYLITSTINFHWYLYILIFILFVRDKLDTGIIIGF